MASFTKEVNPWLGKRPLKTNGRLANHGLTSLVKKATGAKEASIAQVTRLYTIERWSHNVETPSADLAVTSIAELCS